MTAMFAAGRLVCGGRVRPEVAAIDCTLFGMHAGSSSLRHRKRYRQCACLQMGPTLCVTVGCSTGLRVFRRSAAAAALHTLQ